MKETEIDESNLPPLLESWEVEMVIMFTSIANSFGFRKSVGAIFGYMFCQEQPMNLEGIMTHLGMSKGTVSQGLNFLRKAGAIRLAFVPGDRREHFVAEVGLKKLVSGFLRDQIYPQLESGSDRLRNLEDTILDAGDKVPELVHDRMKSLKSWHKQAGMLLPFVQKFLEAKPRA